jgi:hypothetical protein
MPKKSRVATAEEEKFETEHEERIKDRAESTDADLEEALEESFPASDPPSMTRPETEIGAPSKTRKPERADKR